MTFIPNSEAEERPTFWDLRRNYSLETFDCWSSHCPKDQIVHSSQCPKCCQKCSKNNPYSSSNEAFPKRPAIRPNKKVLEILPDYTDDEQEAFVKPPTLSKNGSVESVKIDQIQKFYNCHFFINDQAVQCSSKLVHLNSTLTKIWQFSFQNLPKISFLN